MKHRPSSLPMLKQCPRFESGATNFTESGTDRHAALAAHFAGDDSLIALMDEEQAEGVKWAAEYIRLHAPMSDHKIDFEVRGSRTTDDFEERSGTMDCVCGPHLFDLKWRERDYVPQMADYAMFRMESERFAEVTVHVLYACNKRAQVFRLDHESANGIVQPILDRANDPASAPVPCDYCGWCKNQLMCKAHLERVNAVAAGRGWEPINFHSSEVTDENEMAKLLKMARALKKWVASVEFHALEMWTKQGKQIPGFELKEKKGRQYCTDVVGAFNATGLPQEKFLQACDLRLNTSKKYPDKKGVIDLFAEFSDIKKAAAKRSLLNKLDGFLQTGKPSLTLKATGDDEDGDEASE